MPKDPTTPRAPRIEIRPDIWPALQVEAIARGVSPKELVNSLILAALSPRAHEFMSPKLHDPMIPCTHDPMSPAPAPSVPSVSSVPSGRTAPMPRDLAGKREEEARVSPAPKPGSLTPEAHQALAYILAELEAGREPTSPEAAAHVGLTPTGLGMALAKYGIKAQNTRRGMKSVKIYTKPMMSRIKKILASP
jgi:hypothetical protein